MRWLLFFLTLSLGAQTRPHTSQVRGPSSQQPQLIALVNGRLVQVSLGAGVQLVQSGGGWELRAGTAQVTEAKLVRGPDGGWPIPTGCSVRVVFRNGLRQLQGSDWSITGSILRFTDGISDPSMTDDTVVVECVQ